MIHTSSMIDADEKALSRRKWRTLKKKMIYASEFRRRQGMWKCAYELAHHPNKTTKPGQTVKELFGVLADEWSRETANVSSVTALVSHPSYQQIIALGWAVVPHLLDDLQTHRRMWFPALTAITSIRPFDPSEAGDSKRMTDAWIKWGKMKHLI